MAKIYAELLEKQRFNDPMGFLDGQFQKLPDHANSRAGINGDYQ